MERASNIKASIDDLAAAIELAKEGDDDYLGEAEQILGKVQDEIGAMEVQSLLGGELDPVDAVLTINAGAGGTESCDWASMLFRMYMRYAERKGWQTEIFDLQDGDEAGIKSVTVGVTG